jgi:hypothetical protein
MLMCASVVVFSAFSSVNLDRFGKPVHSIHADDLSVTALGPGTYDVPAEPLKSPYKGINSAFQSVSIRALANLICFFFFFFWIIQTPRLKHAFLISVCVCEIVALLNQHSKRIVDPAAQAPGPGTVIIFSFALFSFSNAFFAVS